MTVTWQFLEIPSRPFVTLDLVDPGEDWALGHAIAAAVGEPDALDGAVVRVRYTCGEEEARRVDHAEIRKLLEFAGAHKVFSITADIVRPERARVAEAHEDLAPLEALRLWTLANDLDESQTGSLIDLTSDYLGAAA